MVFVPVWDFVIVPHVFTYQILCLGSQTPFISQRIHSFTYIAHNMGKFKKNYVNTPFLQWHSWWCVRCTHSTIVSLWYARFDALSQYVGQHDVCLLYTSDLFMKCSHETNRQKKLTNILFWIIVLLFRFIALESSLKVKTDIKWLPHECFSLILSNDLFCFFLINLFSIRFVHTYFENDVFLCVFARARFHQFVFVGKLISSLKRSKSKNLTPENLPIQKPPKLITMWWVFTFEQKPKHRTIHSKCDVYHVRRGLFAFDLRVYSPVCVLWLIRSFFLMPFASAR